MRTIGDLLSKRIEISPKQNSVGTFTEDRKPLFLSFIDYYKKIESLSLALSMIGIEPQEKVVIWSKSNLNWHLMDLAILCSNAITVPVHHDISQDDFIYIWEHCDADYIIIDDKKLFDVYSKSISKQPKKVILIDQGADSVKSSNFLTFDQLMTMGRQEVSLNPDTFKRKLTSLSPDHIATIVYTSGTTGKPKGAVITHEAIMQVMENLKKFSQKSITYQDRFVSCLPLAHILGRCESLFSLNFGCECVFVSGAKTLLKNIKKLEPTMLVLVPQILEHMQKSITENLTKNEINKLIFNYAQSNSRSFFNSIDQSLNPNHFDLLIHQISLRFIYNKVYKSLGGKIRYIITGGAPLQEETFQFFRNIKISVLEGYGLTETFAPCTVNTLHKQYLGTAGVPIGDVLVKFADDGEIMLKTRALFQEYYKDPDSTDNAFEDDWFKTGDIGNFTKHGSLKITGRKKDIIITSGGKNIVPANIEYKLNQSPYINFSYVHGEGKEFLIALIAINKVKCINACKGVHEDFSSLELSQNPQIRKLIKKEITKINAELASYEEIKDFKIMPLEEKKNFHTMSLKLKRNMVLSEYSKEIDAMYH